MAYVSCGFGRVRVQRGFYAIQGSPSLQVQKLWRFPTVPQNLPERNQSEPLWIGPLLENGENEPFRNTNPAQKPIQATSREASSPWESRWNGLSTWKSNPKGHSGRVFVTTSPQLVGSSLRFPFGFPSVSTERKNFRGRLPKSDLPATPKLARFRETRSPRDPPVHEMVSAGAVCAILALLLARGPVKWLRKIRSVPVSRLTRKKSKGSVLGK